MRKEDVVPPNEGRGKVEKKADNMALKRPTPSHGGEQKDDGEVTLVNPFVSSSATRTKKRKVGSDSDSDSDSTPSAKTPAKASRPDVPCPEEEGVVAFDDVEENQGT